MVKRGEIYMTNWEPARGSEQRGTRPAVVIQNDTGNEFAPTTIIAALSTAPHRGYPMQVVITPPESGLRETSTVKLDQLLTVDKGRLRRRVGRLTAEAMANVDQALKYSLGLVD